MWVCVQCEGVIERSQWVTGAYERLFMFILHNKDYGNLFAYELVDPKIRRFNASSALASFELLFLATSSMTSLLCWCALLWISYGNRLDRRWCFKIPKSKKRCREKENIFFGKQETLFDWLLFFLSSCCVSHSFWAMPMSCFRLWIVIGASLARWFSKNNNILIVYLDF